MAKIESDEEWEELFKAAQNDVESVARDMAEREGCNWDDMTSGKKIWIQRSLFSLGRWAKILMSLESPGRTN